MTFMPRITIALFALIAACWEQAAARAPEDLSKVAKISESDARRTALARVQGMVQSEELERENGRVVYSFDIRQADKPGVEEVQVDAVTGQIVSIEHESEATEKKERD
jgi:uncharacterized membrane protein YkoI